MHLSGAIRRRASSGARAQLVVCLCPSNRIMAGLARSWPRRMSAANDGITLMRRHLAPVGRVTQPAPGKSAPLRVNNCRAPWRAV